MTSGGDWQTEPASIEADAIAKAKAKHRGTTAAELRAARDRRRRERRREREAKRAAAPAEQGRRSGIEAARNAQAVRERQQRPRTRQQAQAAKRQQAESQAQMRMMRRAFATPASVFGGMADHALVLRLALGVRALEARASTAAKLGFGAALGRQGKPPEDADGRRTNSGGFKEAQHRLDAAGFITREQTWFRVNPRIDVEAAAKGQDRKPGYCKDALTPKATAAMAALGAAPTINGEAVRVAADYWPPETCDRHGNPIKRGRGKRSGALAKKMVYMQLSALCSKARCTVNLANAAPIVAAREGIARTTVDRHIRALMAEGHAALVEHPGAAHPPKERTLKLIPARCTDSRRNADWQRIHCTEVEIVPQVKARPIVACQICQQPIEEGKYDHYNQQQVSQQDDQSFAISPQPAVHLAQHPLATGPKSATGKVSYIPLRLTSDAVPKMLFPGLHLQPSVAPSFVRQTEIRRLYCEISA